MAALTVTSIRTFDRIDAVGSGFRRNDGAQRVLAAPAGSAASPRPPRLRAPKTFFASSRLRV